MKKHSESLGIVNWVPIWMLFAILFIFLITLIIYLIFSNFYTLIFAIFFFIVFFYFLYSHYLFSERGADIQNKVYQVLLDNINWKGKGRVLEIGCGTAVLSIKLAKKYPEAKITGIDYWQGMWAYYRQIAENNIRIEKVSDQVELKQASASKLPFKDNYFDLVVSNLTFHAVKDSSDRTVVLREAIRVLKAGGQFVFQDAFKMKNTFGDLSDLLESMNHLKLKDMSFIDTSKSDFIPLILRTPFMIGAISIIKGIK